MRSMDDPINLHDIAEQARQRIEHAALEYLDGGANDEITLRENEAAFLRRRLRPRVLRDVSTCDPSTTILGAPAVMPAGIAPTAQHALFHPGGEAATARAAAGHGVPFVASTMSSLTLEEIAAAGGTRWFQLYVQRDRALTRSLVERATAAGYQALVVTVDTPVLGARERDLRLGDEAPMWVYANLGESSSRGLGITAAARLIDPAITWADIDWLRGMTTLPLVLKGIVTGEDAGLAVEHGAAAVWVSNHGGRQLDRVPATIDVLEEVAGAVAGRAEVYVDGGVRRGVDVAIALALGARAVFVGRPILYALAVDGEPGVRAALRIVQDELVNAMALLGVSAVDGITRAHLA
jgi:4-hydroxymandelate oxidase